MSHRDLQVTCPSCHAQFACDVFFEEENIRLTCSECGVENYEDYEEGVRESEDDAGTGRYLGGYSGYYAK